MKSFSIIFLCVFFLWSAEVLSQSTNTDTSQSPPTGASTAGQDKEEKTLGERMVEFILDLVGEAPKSINEELVRDDI